MANYINHGTAGKKMQRISAARRGVFDKPLVMLILTIVLLVLLLLAWKRISGILG
jgi:hypothetical protein